MDEHNPYAAPQAASQPVAPPSSWEGLWRENDLLVMHKDARLPNICVKSGVTVNEPGISRKFSWHNPWLGLFILLNILIYLIIALITTKRATIAVPLSTIERDKRRTGLKIAWVLGLGGLAAFIGSIVMLTNSMDPNPLFLFTMLAGILTALIGLIMGSSRARILSPKKITNTHVWFKGVHPKIIDQLPALPANHGK